MRIIVFSMFKELSMIERGFFLYPMQTIVLKIYLTNAGFHDKESQIIKQLHLILFWFAIILNHQLYKYLLLKYDNKIYWE